MLTCDGVALMLVAEGEGASAQQSAPVSSVSDPAFQPRLKHLFLRSTPPCAPSSCPPPLHHLTQGVVSVARPCPRPCPCPCPCPCPPSTCTPASSSFTSNFRARPPRIKISKCHTFSLFSGCFFGHTVSDNFLSVPVPRSLREAALFKLQRCHRCCCCLLLLLLLHLSPSYVLAIDRWQLPPSPSHATAHVPPLQESHAPCALSQSCLAAAHLNPHPLPRFPPSTQTHPPPTPCTNCARCCNH